MNFLVLVPVLVFSIVVHEVAHAWQARREGDHTAERLGRITLNPLPHLEVVGSVLVPMLLYFTNAGFLFGWARPVPVDPRNFRDYRGGDIRVSLAGIVSNLILAVLFTLLTAGLLVLSSSLPAGVLADFADVLRWGAWYGILINLVLAFFNLIPIPPLDGSHVVYHFLPPAIGARYRAFGRYGIVALMLIVFFVPGLFGVLLTPVYVLMSAADAFIRLWA